MKDHYIIVKYPKGICSSDPVFLFNFGSRNLKFVSELDWAVCFDTFVEAQLAFEYCKLSCKDKLEIYIRLCVGSFPGILRKLDKYNYISLFPLGHELIRKEKPMEATGITAALTTAFTAAAGEMTGAVAAIVPIALPVVTTILVVSLGIKVFKKFTK